MKNKQKLILGLMAVFIVIIAGIGYSYIQFASNIVPNSTNNVITQDDKNSNTQNTVTKKSSSKSTDSKYITTYCKRCGKPFKQLKDGPGYYYCDECENSPEVQQMIEEETEGTP